MEIKEQINENLTTNKNDIFKIMEEYQIQIATIEKNIANLGGNCEQLFMKYEDLS